MVQVERVITIFFEDPEASIACFSGSITDSLVHPQKRSKLFAYLVKTTVVGLFLATFVSPAFHEKFKLTKHEAIAASFVCGYAGIRILNAAEKYFEYMLQKKIAKLQVNSTDVSKSEDSSS